MGRAVIGLMATALVLAGLAAPAAAERSGGFGKWWNSPKMAQDLKITAAERERLDKIYLDFRKDMLDLRSEVGKARLDVDAALDQEPVDKAVAQKAFDRMEKARAAKGRRVHRFMLDVREILGRDRYRQLRSLYNNFRNKRGTRPGAPKPDRPGPQGMIEPDDYLGLFGGARGGA